jgi:acyl-CoA hydrolase
MLSLHLLQSALVLVNTRMVDRVLAEPDWAARLTEHDLRGLTPKEKAPIIIDQIANPKYQPYLYDYFKRACEKCGNSQTPHILSEAFDVYKWFEETGSMEKPAE